MATRLRPLGNSGKSPLLIYMSLNSLPQRKSFGRQLGLSAAHAALLAKLNTPHKIQDYLDSLGINFEPEGDTCYGVARTLTEGKAHCIEAAFIAACALWMAGEKPLVMDFQAHRDYDHVVALFKYKGHWGAISKSNHIWLRWRDPIYRNLRELALSYFHEYVTGERKSLRTYSAPYDMRRVNPKRWITNDNNCFDVAGLINSGKHYQLLTPEQIRTLRPRDGLEQRAGKVVEYTP